MDYSGLDDCFHGHILPYLFRINTNFTILMYRLINKRSYFVVYNLLYRALSAFISGGDYSLVSCDPRIYIAMTDYNSIIRRLTEERTCETTHTHVGGFEDRKFYPGDYSDLAIFKNVPSISDFAADHSTSLEHKLLYFRELYGSYEALFNSDCLKLLIIGLSQVDEITHDTRELLLPGLEAILEGWIVYGTYESGKFINLLVGDDSLLNRMLSKLDRLIRDKRGRIRDIHKLTYACVLINPRVTLTTLGLSEFCDRHNLLESRIPTNISANQSIYRDLSGNVWNIDGSLRVIGYYDVCVCFKIFSERITEIRIGSRLNNNLKTTRRRTRF